MMGHRSRIWSARRKVSFAYALTGCCAVLWLVGSLPVAQGHVAPQWTHPHCPQGQTHGSQHSHNHCLWYCGGIDSQAASVRGGISVEVLISRVWSLGAGSKLDTSVDAEIEPRGPPRLVLVV